MTVQNKYLLYFFIATVFVKLPNNIVGTNEKPRKI